MESVFSRYRNLIVLVAVLFAQVLGLAVQVKRTNDSESTRLIRVWAVDAVTPFERGLHWIQTSTSGIWHNYLYLRGIRAENRDLKHQIEQMRIEQARMVQDADQAHRLQALLAFKEQFISQTVAAQVIGSSGSEQSRTFYIDKGAREGIKPDMAVITKDGIVGKVLQVYGSNPLEASTSQVLLINDQTSGVGAILDKARLQGIVRGTPAGEVMLEKVMSDETVPIGEQVLTSGGDGIFPKGLPIGTVTRVSPGNDLFWNIRVRPAADLDRLEEVLIVTKIDERQAQPDQNGPVRAVDILAERLPTVPPKPEGPAPVGANAPGKPGTGSTAATTTAAGSGTASGSTKPAAVAVTAGTPSASATAKPSVGTSTANSAASGTGKSASSANTINEAKPKLPSPSGSTVPGASGSGASGTGALGTGASGSALPKPAVKATPPQASTGTPNSISPKSTNPSGSPNTASTPPKTNSGSASGASPAVKKSATTPSATPTNAVSTDTTKKPVTKPVSSTPKPQPPAQDAPQ